MIGDRRLKFARKRQQDKFKDEPKHAEETQILTLCLERRSLGTFEILPVRVLILPAVPFLVAGVSEGRPVRN